MASECTVLLLMTLGYEHINRNWLWFQQIGLVFALISFLVSAIILPESPKILYVWNCFYESKLALSYIAEFN